MSSRPSGRALSRTCARTAMRRASARDSAWIFTTPTLGERTDISASFRRRRGERRSPMRRSAFVTGFARRHERTGRTDALVLADYRRFAGDLRGDLDPSGPGPARADRWHERAEDLGDHRPDHGHRRCAALPPGLAKEGMTQ